MATPLGHRDKIRQFEYGPPAGFDYKMDWAFSDSLPGKKREKKLPSTRKHKRWTPSEIEFIRKNYRSMEVKDIAKHFNSSTSSIYEIAKRSGIVKKNRTGLKEEL